MKENPKKVWKALAYVLLAAAATALSFALEPKLNTHASNKMRLTGGCIMALLVSLWYLYTVLTGREKDVDFSFVVEDIFPLTKGGCVVVGKVKGGISAGQKIWITNRTGSQRKAVVSAMEINKRAVKFAKDTPVALMLKNIPADAVHKGDGIAPLNKAD